MRSWFSDADMLLRRPQLGADRPGCEFWWRRLSAPWRRLAIHPTGCASCLSLRSARVPCPKSVLGVSLLLFFNWRSGLARLELGLWSVIVAHITLSLSASSPSLCASAWWG